MEKELRSPKDKVRFLYFLNPILFPLIKCMDPEQMEIDEGKEDSLETVEGNDDGLKGVCHRTIFLNAQD